MISILQVANQIFFSCHKWKKKYIYIYIYSYSFILVCLFIRVFRVPKSKKKFVKLEFLKRQDYFFFHFTVRNSVVFLLLFIFIPFLVLKSFKIDIRFNVLSSTTFSPKLLNPKFDDIVKFPRLHPYIVHTCALMDFFDKIRFF